METNTTQTHRYHFVRGHYRKLGERGHVWVNGHVRREERPPCAAAATHRDIDTIIRKGRARMAKAKADHERAMAEILDAQKREGASVRDREEE